MTDKTKVHTRGRMVSNDKCKNILSLRDDIIFTSAFSLKILNINENTSFLMWQLFPQFLLMILTPCLSKLCFHRLVYSPPFGIPLLHLFNSIYAIISIVQSHNYSNVLTRGPALSPCH